MNTITSIGIIGYGRMGKLIERMLAPVENLVELSIYDRNNTALHGKFKSFEATCKTDLIIPAIPIPAFEDIIKQIVPHLTAGQTIMHICSVQIYPKEILLAHTPDTINIIGSHPMFGPQTLKACNGSFKDLNFVIESIRCDQNVFQTIEFFLKSLQFNLVHMSAEEHDKKAAKFHFVSHMVANVLTQMDLSRTPIDTKSYEFLFNFLDRIDPDTKLMQSMLKYNPYAQTEAKRFEKEYTDINNLLFPQS